MNVKGSVMPKSGVALLAVGLIAGHFVTGSTDEATAAAPVNVGLAWADGGVRVTWPTDSAPNLLRATDAQGTAFEQLVPAASADSIVLPVSRFPVFRELTITVYTRASDTATTPDAAVGQSPAFDTDRRITATVTKRQPNGNGTFSLGWTVGTAPDYTPNDPLDVSPVATATPYVSDRVGCGWTALASVHGSTGTATIPARVRPYRVFLRSPNEWGTVDTNAFEVADYVVSSRVPAASTYGTRIFVTGRVQLNRPSRCVAGKTQAVYRDDAIGWVQVQARNTSTSAWSTVSSWRTDPDGTFEGYASTPGTRQYRVLMPSAAKAPQYGFGDVAAFVAGSSASTSIARYALRTARIDYPQATYGRKVSALLTVAPGTNVRATLQRWNGSTWANVKWVYTKNGVGSYSFTAAPRGVHAFRYVVPGAYYAGRYITGITTPTFRMTVR
ncbi:hypothetical protein OG394_20975 [Kribbella sp. NBC_01245]|uniref:hypothetical protein n=1 Tax=Kribbella sp. NBC_01245 TaxID=2903578 RepID=UPI002E2909DA|nr:hypothetical protein [Kribbella sp. NBC_01245]